jgi:hypothetical protein
MVCPVFINDTWRAGIPTLCPRIECVRKVSYFPFSLSKNLNVNLLSARHDDMVGVGVDGGIAPYWDLCFPGMLRVYIGTYLLTFRDKLWLSSSRVKQSKATKNYQVLAHNNPEERRSLLKRGESLKWRAAYSWRLH